MKSCCICKKKQKPGNGSFFSVPNDDRRLKWSKICSLDFSRHAVVCADHFAETNIIRLQKSASLLPDAVPIMLDPKNTALLPDAVPALSIKQNFGYPSFNNPVTNIAPMPVYNNPVAFCKEHAMDQSLPQCQGMFEVFKSNRKLQEKVFSDKETQTTPESPSYIEYYTKKIQSLETEIKELKCNLAKANAAVDAMRKIFTDGQVRKMMFPGNINWRWPDISSAICLHAAGPRAYSHLYKKGFPLPHVSTLQRWSRKVNLREGILTTAIDFMREITDLDPEDKICVLVFDEMKVVETFEYDEVADAVRTPVNYVQVVMVRGLRKSWKQPVFYSFDCQMTVQLIEKITSELHKVGFLVVAMVCDMGPTNRKLWRELNISPEKPWFPHPINQSEKIFVFADVPHLIKLIRNHFLDTGLIYEKNLITSRTFVDLLKHTSASDVSITFKLSTDHLDVKGPGRQKVKLATQLFSHTSANAILRCYSLGMEMCNPVITAEFVQLVNDWFDVHNSTLDTFHYPGKEPFGIALERQQQILTRMTEVMSSPVIPSKKTLEFFQKGIITSNNSLQMLLKYVSDKFKMHYICTKRLNQDILENFFGAIRSKGGLNDHPTPKDFKYRLRKYILARNTEHLSGTGNVGYDTTEWLNNSNEQLNNNSFAQYKPSKSQPDLLEDDESDAEPDTLDDLDVTNFPDIGALQEDALEYISGYIIRKLHLEEHLCHENSYTYVDQLSKGYLKKPATSFVEQVKALEVIFYKINGHEISHLKCLHQRLLKESEFIELSGKIKAFFFKCRIHFRIRHLNKRLKAQKCKQKKMGFKKMIKINL